MVAADQAFDSLQSQRLQEFEELFENRYTEKDKEYKKATQESQRSTNVPVMDPWPPKRCRSRGGRDRNRRYDRTPYHSKDHRGSDRYPHNDIHEPRNITSNEYPDESDRYNHSGGEPHTRISPPTHQDLPDRHIIDQKKPLLDTFKDSPKRPPTESECQDMLSFVASSNTFKSTNLQKERMKAKKTATKKPKPITSTTKPTLESSSFSKIPLKSSASGQGRVGESQTASLIKSQFATSSNQKLQRNKRRHSALEEDKTSGSDSEHIDVEGDFVPVIGGPSLPLPLPLPSPPPVIVKQPFYAASNVQSHDFSSLVVSLPLKYMSQDQGRSDGRQRLVDGPITEGDIRKPSKAKKRKKHKKHSGDKESLEKSLKLKIKVPKP